MDNIQIKVAQLENTVKQQSQEMEALKYEIQDISNEINRLDMNSLRGPVEEPLLKEKTSTSAPAKTDKNDDIIRVEITPQQLQTALKKAGYYDGIVDGKIGPKTKEAITQFQKDHGLTADGVVGKKTWAEIKSYLK
jgi:murein L,D-transpeptidase YcbB/YkuD